MLVDLMSRDFGGKRPDETVEGFLASRWYATDAARRELARIVLAAAAQRTSNSSAQTWRTAMSAFVRYGEPLYISPNTSLEEALIAPFRRRLEQAGVEIVTGWRILGVEAEAGKVTQALFETSEGHVTQQVENLVLAVPPQVVARLKGEAIAQAGFAVAPLEMLCQRPMSALHLYMRKSLEMPREHVALVHSKYSISLYDLAKARQGYDTSCLNMVIADPGELGAASFDKVVAEVMPEVKRYLPFIHAEDIEDGLWQPHADNPLFSNEVGSWAHRPEPVTALGNLFLAGDYVRNHMDVVGMETAAVSGLNAAEAVRQRLGLRAAPVKVERPKSVPRWAAAAARTALWPTTAVAYALSPNRRKA
jgi:phytoene dehydrogenase-like protein